MASFAQIQTTGIYIDEETQCFEAWLVSPKTGDRVLVATCSRCVPGDQYQWWVQQVWNVWMPEWGISRAVTRVA